MLGIYTRLSREDVDSNSINNQLREGKRFAKKHKLKYKLFNEGEGLSGGLGIEDRPQLLELTNAISRGEITVAWFRDQNRLERNSSTFLEFVGLIKETNCEVYYSNEKVDYTKPNVVFQGTIYSAFSQLQKDMQSKKTIRALKQNAEEGKAHGISPYGYTKDDKGYIIINGKESEIVKRIFKLSLDGKGTNKIAEILNADEVPTRYNAYDGKIVFKNKTKTKVLKSFSKKNIKWAGNTIRGIIKNPIYKGERHLKSGIYKAPNIIEPYYWQQVNDNFKANANNSGKKVEHKYMLKGIIKCGKCGRNYYGRTRVNKKDNYYMCSSKRYKDLNCGNRSINIDVLESFIWNRFFIEKELLNLTQAFFKDTDTDAKLKEIRSHLRLINDDLKTIESKRKKAINFGLDDLITKDELRAKLKELDTKKNDWHIKLERLIEDEKYYMDIELNKDKELNDLNETYTNASFNKKREVVQKYIKEIDIRFIGDLYLIKFHYNFTVTPEFADEVYFIDRGYNVIFELCNKYIMPLSKKTNSMNKKELKYYADDLWNKFEANHLT